MNPQFPYFDEDHFVRFPPLEKATPEGIVAVGGNLSPGMLLSAYSQGIFPWFSEGDPILWWSPDPRCVFFPSDIHISQSMKKILKRNLFSVTLDTRFREVITLCQSVPRKNQEGTWITDAMRDAYIELHRLGFAHSVEVWQEDFLAGGMYGISLGRCFFGESMFTLTSNASKVALITLAKLFFAMGFDLFDCQVYSPHLETLGARQIPRAEFLHKLKMSLEFDTFRGSWEKLPHFFGVKPR
jgi:leucyl/phenylalanyl-tRNA--protein transferase